VKLEHAVKLDGSEMSIVRWMCGFALEGTIGKKEKCRVLRTVGTGISQLGE